MYLQQHILTISSLNESQELGGTLGENNRPMIIEKDSPALIDLVPFTMAI